MIVVQKNLIQFIFIVGIRYPTVGGQGENKTPYVGLALKVWCIPDNILIYTKTYDIEIHIHVCLVVCIYMYVESGYANGLI